MNQYLLDDNYFYFNDLAKQTKPQTLDKAVEVFGKDEVVEVLESVIAEETETFHILRKRYEKQVAHFKDRPDDGYKIVCLARIDATTGKKLRECYETLERCGRQLRKLKPKNVIRTIDRDIEQARTVPIETLLEARVRHVGGRAITLCPFHTEKTPSFTVYADNSFHCFGCGKHGNNAIDFVMADGTSFIDAVRRLV